MVYYFKKGDSNVQEPGTYHVKAVVEHLFTGDTNMTFDYFESRHQAMLRQNQGKFAEKFIVAPSSLVSSKIAIWLCFGSFIDFYEILQ